jgi:hypothetical protein
MRKVDSILVWRGIRTMVVAEFAVITFLFHVFMVRCDDARKITLIIIDALQKSVK